MCDTRSGPMTNRRRWLTGMATGGLLVAGESTAPNRDISRLREMAPRQTPFAAFLGCADSRVPIEIVFDQGFGDLFVTRIAGNIAATDNIASLEFATQVLGAKSPTCWGTPRAEPWPRP